MNKTVIALTKEIKLEKVQTDNYKRLLDIIVATGLLLMFSPIMILSAVLIKLSSRGPVIFSQKRVGLNGQEFTIYKFRTMSNDMGDEIHRAFMKKVIQKVINVDHPHKPVFKMKDDPRITKIGKFLRKTSLDELPQLFNVLKGDMSMVGPRPPIGYEVEHYEPWQLQRLNALPGITGLWQVSGRNHTDFETMVRQDIEYIQTRNLWLDLKIIFKTVPAMLTGH